MDINAQCKILEQLLKQEQNRECADCNSKTPRWASITFGTFVCLRCSGMHRQLQVHITKIKSVNLDKWQPEMVEMYKHVNNHIINSYWEYRLPKGFQKPGPSASSQEVENFIKDKYVHKKWVQNIQVADPAYLYWNDRKKFNKYLEKLKGAEEEDEEEEDEDSEDEKKKKAKKEKKKDKKDKKKDKKEKKDEPISLKGPLKHSAAPVADLIDFNAAPIPQQPTGNLLHVDDFQEFQDAAPQNDGFEPFQGSGSQQQQPVGFNPGVNIQGIMNMYSQQPPQNKYSAFDQMGGYNQMPGAGQQQPFQPQYSNLGGMQQQQPGHQARPQFQPQQPNQTNLFSGQNLTINVNQYGQPQPFGGAPAGFQQPAQQFQQQPAQGFVPNLNSFQQPAGFKPPQQQPFQQNSAFSSSGTSSFGSYGGSQASGFGGQMGFNSSPLKTQSQNQNAVGGLYGGLVNLDNLGTKQGSAGSVGGGFGTFQTGVGAGQKQDAFGGLMSGKWA